MYSVINYIEKYLYGIFIIHIVDHALITIDKEESVAFDRTPLSIASQGARGPRTPCMNASVVKFFFLS